MWWLLTVITKDSSWRQTKRLVWLRLPSEQQSLMLGPMLPLAVSLKHRLLRQLGQGGKLIVACRVRRLPSICSSDLFTWLSRTTTQLAMHDVCHCSQVLRLPEVVSPTALFCLGFTENRTSTSSSFFRDILFRYAWNWKQPREVGLDWLRRFCTTGMHYAPCIRDKTFTV